MPACLGWDRFFGMVWARLECGGGKEDRKLLLWVITVQRLGGGWGSCLWTECLSPGSREGAGGNPHASDNCLGSSKKAFPFPPQ